MEVKKMANEVTVIDRTEITAFQTDGAGALEKAKEMARAIVDNASLGRAADMMLEAKRRILAIQARFEKPKADAHAAHRSICELEAQLCEVYKRIEREVLKPAISQFTLEQERLRRQEEDRQRAEATKREEDARIKRLLELDKQGKKEQAEALLNVPVEVAAIVVPKAEAPRGVSFRERWDFVVEDAELVPRAYLTVDMVKIGAIVRALKGETRIAGIRVTKEQIISGRV